MKLNKLQKLLVNMADRVWSFVELRKMWIERIDSGTMYASNQEKRFGGLLHRGMMKNYILRPERGRYMVSKSGKKYIKWLGSEDAALTYVEEHEKKLREEY
jgi:hypothetical protein